MAVVVHVDAGRQRVAERRQPAADVGRRADLSRQRSNAVRRPVVDVHRSRAVLTVVWTAHHQIYSQHTSLHGFYQPF